jgi:hypothetical protein
VIQDSDAEATPETSAPLTDERLTQGIITRVSGSINASAAQVSEFGAQAPPAECRAIYAAYLAFLRQTAADAQAEGIDFYDQVAAVRAHDAAMTARHATRARARWDGPKPAQRLADAVNRELGRLHASLVVTPE